MSTINTITKTLSIAPDGIPTVMRLSQNENGRQLVFELSDAVPGGSTVVLAGTKPDGRVYSIDGTLDDNVATFDEDLQMTAVAGEWDAKVIILNDGDTVATGRVRFLIDPDTTNGSVPSDSQLDGIVAQAQAYAEVASQYAYGAPLAALTAADMTDHDQIYVYVGSEEGYNAGDWYYWDGAAWTSGGQYGAGTVNVDTTISTSSHNPVENRAIGQALAVKIGYPARAGGVNYGSAGQLLAATGDESRVQWVSPQLETEHADADTYGTIKLQRLGDPISGLQMKVTFDDDKVDYVPRINNMGFISSAFLPSASTLGKGAVILDDTVSTTGKAADAKAVRDLVGKLSDLDTTDKSNIVGAINEIASGGGGGGGLTNAIKTALLQLAEKVAYIDDDGQQYYDDLYDALYPPIPATDIILDQVALGFTVLNTMTAVNATVFPETSTDTPTWASDDTDVAVTVPVQDNPYKVYVKAKGYGTCTVTATAGEVSTTLPVTVTQPSVSSISAVYTQSGTVYDTDSLDSLKTDLVVTAYYTDSTSEAVAAADYTLSGTLEVGTSTVTVTYDGKTDSFTVTVSEGVLDTTAEIITEDYVLGHRSTEPNYYNDAVTNGGITKAYDMTAPSVSLCPAGIVPTLGTVMKTTPACLYILDSNGDKVSYVNMASSSSFNRWAKDASGTMTEFCADAWVVSQYSKIQFSVDKRYLDDAYMYDKITGQVWFAGKNTPYYGKTTILNAGDPLYPFDDATLSGSSISGTLSGGNHFVVTTSANSREAYAYINGKFESSTVTFPVLFSLKAGDTISVSMKNFSYENSSSASNYMYCSVFQQGGTTALYSAGKVNFGSGSGTLADITDENTVSADANVAGIKITIYRSVKVTFDYEVRVNGVLYIGSRVTV